MAMLDLVFDQGRPHTDARPCGWSFGHVAEDGDRRALGVARAARAATGGRGSREAQERLKRESVNGPSSAQGAVFHVARRGCVLQRWTTPCGARARGLASGSRPAAPRWAAIRPAWRPRRARRSVDPLRPPGRPLSSPRPRTRTTRGRRRTMSRVDVGESAEGPEAALEAAQLSSGGSDRTAGPPPQFRASDLRRAAAPSQL